MVAEQWIFFSVLGALQMLTSLSAWEQHCCALQQARPAIAAAVAHTIKLFLQRGFIQAIACHQQPPNGSAIALLLAHLWGGGVLALVGAPLPPHLGYCSGCCCYCCELLGALGNEGERLVFEFSTQRDMKNEL